MEAASEAEDPEPTNSPWDHTLSLYHQHLSNHHLPLPKSTNKYGKKLFTSRALQCSCPVKENGEDVLVELRMLTWLSQAVRGKLFHATEGGAEPAPLLLVAKGVDHPNTHAGVGEKEQHSGLNTVCTRTSLAEQRKAPQSWGLKMYCYTFHSPQTHCPVEQQAPV